MAPAMAPWLQELKHRFLILDTYYPQFLHSFYNSRPKLLGASYDEQHRALMDSMFGTSDYYSTALKEQGHEAVEVVPNCAPLQGQWAAERMGGRRAAAEGVPPATEIGRVDHEVVRAQIAELRPDVLYLQDLTALGESFLRDVKPLVGMVAGQVACPLNASFDYSVFDLVLSSFPHFVTGFRECGVASEYMQLGFEPRVWERLAPELGPRRHDVVFVGGYTAAHRKGNELLEALGEALPVEFWGYGAEALDSMSPIRRRFRGAAWGREMYRVLGEARIVLNRHIDVAGRYANNMRLYEATGMGSLLLTDAKENLGEIFEPGRQVVAYRGLEECVELARHYLEHEGEREEVARAGQQRTMKEHTYARRTEYLAEAVDQHWGGGRLPRVPDGIRRGYPALALETRSDGGGPRRVLRGVVGRIPGARLAWKGLRRGMGMLGR